jgi:hypothetical protein
MKGRAEVASGVNSFPIPITPISGVGGSQCNQDKALGFTIYELLLIALLIWPLKRDRLLSRRPLSGSVNLFLLFYRHGILVSLVGVIPGEEGAAETSVTPFLFTGAARANNSDSR